MQCLDTSPLFEIALAASQRLIPKPSTEEENVAAVLLGHFKEFRRKRDYKAMSDTLFGQIRKEI